MGDLVDVEASGDGVVGVEEAPGKVRECGGLDGFGGDGGGQPIT